MVNGGVSVAKAGEAGREAASKAGASVETAAEIAGEAAGAAVVAGGGSQSEAGGVAGEAAKDAGGSAASSVVVDLGFCGVSTTALRFSSDQLFSASRRTLRAYTTPSFVRTRCSSVRSLFPSHTPDFHLSANFGAGFPDPFPTSGRCARTVSPNSTNFPRYGRPMAG